MELFKSVSMIILKKILYISHLVLMSHLPGSFQDIKIKNISIQFAILPDFLAIKFKFWKAGSVFY